jgi:hypothetical protein
MLTGVVWSLGLRRGAGCDLRGGVRPGVGSRQREALEQEGVDGDEQAGSGHRQRRDLGAEREAEGGLEGSVALRGRGAGLGRR